MPIRDTKSRPGQGGSPSGTGVGPSGTVVKPPRRRFSRSENAEKTTHLRKQEESRACSSARYDPTSVSQKAGLDADVSVIQNDAAGPQQWPTNRFPPNYSREGTQELVNVMRHAGGSRVRLIISADQQLTGVMHDT
jgi:hypothetical protein